MGAPQYEQAGADIGGTGTTNTIPRWTGASTLGDSIITQSGTNRIGVTGAIWCDAAGGVGGVAFGMTDSASIRQTGTNAIMYFDASTTGGNGQFVWRSGNSLTERARIDSSGNVGIGTASPASRLDVAGTITCDDAGTGLKLQGTAGTNNTDPNVLDFYADGGTPNSGGVTWTPVVKFGGTDITTLGGAYDSRVGRYTRIGNMVYATFWLKLTAKGTATGLVTIAGLPTSANVPGLYTSGTIGLFNAITYTGQLTAVVLSNSAEIRLYQTTEAGAVSTVTNADFANNSEIAIQVSYPVN